MREYCVEYHLIALNLAAALMLLMLAEPIELVHLLHSRWIRTEQHEPSVEALPTQPLSILDRGYELARLLPESYQPIA